jgi:toxin HigB-1
VRRIAATSIGERAYVCSWCCQFLKLTQLDAAVTNDDMGSPPGNDLKFYEGFWHIRINDQWRLAWQWTGDRPENVKFYDPH